MGKKIRDEDMVLNIIINGDQGRAELLKLEQAIKDLSIANEGLAARKSKMEQEMKKLEKAGKTDTDVYRNLQAEVRQLTADMTHNEASIQQARQRMETLRSGMDLTKMTISDLRREMARLQKLRNTSVPGTAQWKQYDAELTAVATRLRQVQSEGEATKGALCRMADGVNKYWNLVVSGLASFAGVFFSIKGAVSKFLEFTDVLSDTRKTTGLTQQEVEELNGSLEKIDTRTPQDELLGLGRIAGKLGIEGKENIEGFVRAADQINIALKEDLGDNTEEAINQVGKLVDIFRVSENYGIEQGMLKVGSVINELGAASTANEGYIVEFTKRAAGVAPMAGVTVQNVMGLGATLDQFGQQCEASGSVYTKMMTQMYKQTGAFARVAGMETKAFSDLLEKDANEAFIRVLENLKGNDAAMESIVANLGDLKLNGVRATTVIGTLADHTDTLRKQQELANEAFAEGISLTNEANIKNKNAAALDAKRRKERERLIVDLGSRLQPVMAAYNSTLNLGLKVLKELVVFFSKYGTTMLGLTGAITAHIVVLKAEALWKKTMETLTLKAIALSTAETASVNTATKARTLYTVAVKGSIRAVKSFFAAITTNPWGLVLTALVGLGTVIYKLATYSTEAEKAQRRLQGAIRESEAAAFTEQRELAKLKGELAAVAKGSDEYEKIKDKIVEKYGKYDKNLSDEIEKVGFLNETYQRLTESIQKSFGARQYEKFKQGESDNLEQILSDNLGKIQDRLLKELGDELGTKYYTTIRNALLQGEELSEETIALLNKVQDKGTIMADARLDAYIDNIREAQKTFEEIDKKSRIKFGIEIPSESIKDLNTLNAELVVAEKRLEELQRIRPDIFSEEEIARQKQYISGLKESIKKLEEQKELSSKKGSSTEPSALDYNGQIIALKERYAAQKITKEEYEKQLDDLELAHLEYRLKNFEGEEEKRRELEQNIADKKVSIREKRDKEENAKEKDKSREYIDSLLAGNDELVGKEELAYNDRLRKAGIFGKDREKLTAKELTALEILEKQHQQNLKKIEDDARKKKQTDYLKETNDQIKQQESQNAKELLIMQVAHAEEIAGYEGSRTGLKALKKKHHQEEMELAEKQANEMIGLLEGIFYGLQADELLLGEQMLPEEELENLEKKILEFKRKAAGIKGELNNPDAENTFGANVDILGMTPDQWETFLGNLKEGKFGIEELVATVGVLQSAWGTYDKFKTAQERKELKRYEQKTKKEKAALDKQLDAGAISQEQYNARTAQLDAELDAKQEEIAKKQAKRQKAMAITQVIIDTAVGMIQLWKKPGFPAAIPLMAVLGALSAVQLGIIAAQQYAKGKYPVIGEDDGMTYEADYAGGNLQTGIYQRPTLGLFSEKEPEMVVDGATTRRLVLDYPQIYQNIMDVAHGRAPQYASGKYPLTSPSVPAEPGISPVPDPEMKALLRKNIEMMESLKGMDVVISMYGRNGLMKALKKAQYYEQNTTF